MDGKVRRACDSLAMSDQEWKRGSGESRLESCSGQGGVVGEEGGAS